MLSINGKTADDVWLTAARSFCGSSIANDLDSRGGPTSELLHVGLGLEDPRQRWVRSRHPALNPAFAIAEVFWMLAGRDDAAFLTSWNSQLPKFVGPDPVLHGAYGARLRRWFGIDQLASAYNALHHNKSTRQVVLQIWSAHDDLPVDRGKPRSRDVPCNICASLQVRDGRLHWLQIMRSNDLVRGLPYNFVQFTTLQEVMAGWLGVGLGEYTHVTDSLHVYNSDLEVVMHSKREDGAHNADSLAVPKDEFDSILPIMIESIAACADPHTHATELHRLDRTVSVPEGYRNLLFVVAAESARRRHWPDDAQSLIGCCTNPTLVLLWRQWNDRFQKVIAER